MVQLTKITLAVFNSIRNKLVSHFHPRLVFASSYNAPAYHGTEKITAVDGFIVLAPVANVIKLFLT